MTSLLNAASKASFWNVSSNIITGVVRFAITAVLAHFLSPEEFGIAGIAFIVMGLISVFGNTGLGSALIYKKDADETYHSTVYWTNLSAGVLMSLVTIALAYPASIFFSEKTVFFILLILSLNFTISMLASIHFVKLQQEVNYKVIGLGDIISNLVAGTIAISIAYLGAGVWSVVFQSVAVNLIRTIWLWMKLKWVPKLLFDRRKFIELFRYSRNILMEAILNYCSQNIDYFIIGKGIGAKGLGYYKLAYSLVHIPYENFSKKLTPVLFPILCSVKDQPKKFKRGYLNAVKFNTMAVFPAMTSFFFIAQYFIPVVYGTKWAVIVPTAKILALSGMIRCLNTFSGTVFNSQGRPDIGLKFNLFMFPIILAALILCAPLGINAIAGAMLVTVIISGIILHIILVKTSKIFTYKDIALALRPGVINSVILFAILFFLLKIINLNNDLFNLIFYATVSAGLINLIYFAGFRDDFKELAGFASSILKK